MKNKKNKSNIIISKTPQTIPKQNPIKEFLEDIIPNFPSVLISRIIGYCNIPKPGTDKASIWYVKVTYQEGVCVYLSPTYSAEATDVIIKYGEVVPCSEQRFADNTGYLKFYKLFHGEGWIHNYNPVEHTAHNAVQELPQSTFSNIPFAELKGNDAKFNILNLSSSGCGNAEAMVIAYLLQKNSTLTTLNLSSNEIGDTGATAISKSLKRNSALRKLILSQNQICDIGAEAIAEGLKVNITLTKISLYDNQIGNVGAELIGDSLTVNDTLQELSLAFNKIGDTGAKTIAKAIKKNTTIERIYLGMNPFSGEGKKALKTARKNHPSIIKLYY